MRSAKQRSSHCCLAKMSDVSASACERGSSTLLQVVTVSMRTSSTQVLRASEGARNGGTHSGTCPMVFQIPHKAARLERRLCARLLYLPRAVNPAANAFGYNVASQVRYRDFGPIQEASNYIQAKKSDSETMRLRIHDL